MTVPARSPARRMSVYRSTTRAQSRPTTAPDQLLLDWFIRQDLDAALQNFSSNLRPNWSSIFDSTAIDGNCSFTQVEGTVPDQSGTVTARYSIDGCRVLLRAI
ncbi:MAG: hypothetical protein R2849_04450 [Thermomicrobiales bacterium]